MAGIPLENVLMLSAGVCILFLASTTLFWLQRYRKLQNNLELEIKQADEKARQAIKAKDIFLANISHETRTPMNAIIGLSHILLQSNLNDDQQKNLFKIKRSAEHLLSITNDILDYSKLEAGKLTLEAIPIDNNDFFNNISDIMAPMAIDNKIDLVFDISPELPVCWEGDPLRISQILLNLLNNAVKFTEKGEVILRATPELLEDKDAIRFDVIDSGIGLTEEQLTVLFDAFSQADNSISRKFGGTGLGLSISSELAVMMGSHIEVKSRHGEGSTFSFVLPIDKAQSPDEKHARLSIRLLEEKSILLADSNETNTKVLAAILSHFKAKPKIASSPTELQRLIEWERYDAIIIDSRWLSQLDIDKLKTQCDALVTTLYDLLPGAAVKQLAPDALLHKPFTPLSVQSTMTDIFGKTIIENSISKKHVSFDDILVLQGSRILLAEDNEGNVMVIEGLLENSGITLHNAVNGRKAVEMLLNADTPYDLILMDINMPVMDGYAATSILREYQKYDNLPIIAMTANINESDIKKTRSVGMQDFLGKPVDIEQFYTLLLKYIKPKKAPTILQTSPRRKPVETASKNSSIALPGVDTHEGISRVNGNRDAYSRILKKYAELFKDIVSKLDNAVAQHAHSEGAALAHNLKGLSGNIGADELYRLAADIESGFKSGSNDLSALIRTLDTQLKPVLEGIERLAVNTPVQEKTPITPAALSGILESMRESALRKKALDVKQGCQTLRGHILPAHQQQQFDHLFKSADRYRYDEVIGQIDLLLGSVQ